MAAKKPARRQVLKVAINAKSRLHDAKFMHYSSVEIDGEEYEMFLLRRGDLKSYRQIPTNED